MKNKIKNTNSILIKLISFTTMIGLLFSSNPVFVLAQNNIPTGKDPEIQTIAQKLKKQKEAIDEIQERVQSYEKKIQSKRNEALSIKNQLETFSDQISQTKLEIELKQEQIKEINLKIAETKNRIDKKENEIKYQKEKISEFIRLLYKTNQKDPIEILLSNNAFSEFFDQTQHLETIEKDLSTILKNPLRSAPSEAIRNCAA